jgi:hypothetical protein
MRQLQPLNFLVLSNSFLPSLPLLLLSFIFFLEYLYYFNLFAFI